MWLLILRVLLFVLIVLFVLANIVIPAFMKNVPFFWMIKIRKAEKKYTPQIKKADDDFLESAVQQDLKNRKPNN